MEYEDSTRIATAEGLELEVALAGIGSRLTARIIDDAIRITIAVVALVGYGAAVAGSSASDALLGVIAVVMLFLIFWGYDVLWEAFGSGRTPGKRVMGLRVVGTDGEPETLSMAAVRNIMRLVDEVLTLYLGALISIVRSPRNQRLGDMAAGTMVVKETRPVDSGEASLRIDAIGSLDRARAWDVTAITDEELSAARRFLERRASLDATARARLAADLAARLGPKVHGTQAQDPPEQFLELLVAVKAGRD